MMKVDIITCLLLCAGVLSMSSASGAEWEAKTNGEGFITRKGEMLLPVEGMAVSALELSFPAQKWSEPGWFAEWASSVEFPAGPCKLVLYCSDDFFGPTAGFHFVQVLVDGQVCWEQDVAGAAMVQRVEVAMPAGEGLVISQIAVRLYDKKAVSNFAVTVKIGGLKLVCNGREQALLPLEPVGRDYREYPPDLPLPASEVRGHWTRAANILQPWGSTQTVAIREAQQWAPRFANDFGFDAIIMLPPEAHNAITVGEARMHEGISDEQFANALQTYREKGMKFIMYSSVMHCGHGPAWQFGQLAKAHPEWSMRDADGGLIKRYGNAWLCPSTGALEYTLQYTADLARKFQADGVMLDNNSFMFSEAKQPTCYCGRCQEKFRQYVLERFKHEQMDEILGLTATEIRIPEHDQEPLWGLWLSWRKRVWAQVMEAYRAELRQINPDMVVLANTQYLYGSWILAIDRQYEHEDAVLSESRGYDGTRMAAKMTLGQALAQGRPLWNYIGTFQDKDFRKLRPPERVRSICAASIGAGANPWIVFYGFTGEDNEPSIKVLTEYMAFWSGHAELLGGGRDAAEVGLLFSPETRDLYGRQMPQRWLQELLGEGVAVRGLWEPRGCRSNDLEGLSVICAPARCLRQQSAQRLASWVREGGQLLVTPYTGWADEYGRQRSQSALSATVGQNVSAPGRHASGRGTVLCLEDERQLPDEVMKLVAPEVAGEGSIGAFRRLSDDGRSVLALVGFEGPIGTVTARVPRAVKQAKLYVPGHEAQTVSVEDKAGQACVSFTVDEALAVVVW